MRDVIRVGMADYKICSPPSQLSTLGLGSCMGVVIYDPTTKLCGMAHVMLPDSTKITKNENRMKFVDTCLDDMCRELIEKGANAAKFYAKIAGGAKMFSFQTNNEMLNIGNQNVKAVQAYLQKRKIPVVSEDVEKDYSRSILFDPEDGMLHIKAVGIGVSII